MSAPIAITCGDPAGIGPEVIEKWIQSKPECDVHLFGPRSWIEQMECAGTSVGAADFQVCPGKPGREGAKVAFEAMEAAAAACASGQCAAVVTGPISKSEMVGVGYTFPGQTEFFVDRWGGVPSMAFVGERLRVVLATWHHPLRDIPELLERDPELINAAVRNADQLCRSLDLKSARIAVCGLNPHAGEAGLLGHEERMFIDPQLDILRQDYPGLTCCLPGDTVFWRMLQGEFDCIVAMYHDQALAPLKAVEFESAVNVTLGLPWVRTSPDHGTAFGIAGKGIADPRSFGRAVELARRWVE